MNEIILKDGVRLKIDHSTIHVMQKDNCTGIMHWIAISKNDIPVIIKFLQANMGEKEKEAAKTTAMRNNASIGTI